MEDSKKLEEGFGDGKQQLANEEKSSHHVTTRKTQELSPQLASRMRKNRRAFYQIEQ